MIPTRCEDCVARRGAPISTRRSKKIVEPLAQELEAPIAMPMDVVADRQLEPVFERILAHDAARKIAGTTLYVDGGYHIID
jgi:enoyl-[acyl-carrier-protein] reductase (NADH)